MAFSRRRYVYAAPMDLASTAPLIAVGLIAAVSCASLARYTSSLRDGAPWRMASISVWLLVFVLTVWPVVAAVMPTATVAEAKGLGTGGIVMLPQGFSGPARILVRGAPPGDANAETQIAVNAGGVRGEAVLARHFEGVRVGKGGRMMVERDAFAKVLTLSIPEGTSQVSVAVGGAGLDANGLTVRVYRDICPLMALVAFDLLALIAVVMVALRGGESRIIAGGGALLGFAIAATHFVEPAAVIRPLIGALLIGGVGGAAVAGLIGTIATRFTAKPSKVRTPRPA
jgi:hypothetical protein